jgi:hypothetical protein
VVLLPLGGLSTSVAALEAELAERFEETQPNVVTEHVLLVLPTADCLHPTAGCGEQAAGDGQLMEERARGARKSMRTGHSKESGAR